MTPCPGADCGCIPCRAARSDLPRQQLAAYKKAMQRRSRSTADRKALVN